MDVKDARRADRSLAVLAIVLAVAAAVCVLTPLRWEVRFPVVVLACLIGPAIPALRLWTDLDLWTACVAGLGVDVALVMVVAQAMVLAGAWGPSAGVLLLLAATGVAGLLLLRRPAAAVAGGEAP
jgi:hypothetical protein